MHQHLSVHKLIIAIIVAACFTIISLLYAVTLNRLLLTISPQNRRINASIPFLHFALLTVSIITAILGVPYIPKALEFCNLAVQLIVIRYLAASLNAEFIMRGMGISSNAFSAAGTCFIVLCTISEIMVAIQGSMYLISGLLYIASIILWIIYWAGIAHFKNKLKQTPVFEPGSSRIFS